MSYQVLARKYRPQEFSEVVGQQHIVKTLSNSIKNDRISQAYLFIGPRGLGKTSIARIFAKSLNCEKGQTLKPCNKCNSCVSITNSSSIDVIEFDAASYRRVPQVKEKILDNIQYKPVESRYKIFIIDEVHMFSKHSFNALLKTIEEPPPHVIFIFATTDSDKVPETISSRCQRFVFHRIPSKKIKNQLIKIVESEGLKIDEDAADLIARESDGIMRDAQSLLDQIIALSDDEIKLEDVEVLSGAREGRVAGELIKKIIKNDFEKIVKYINKVNDEGLDFEHIAEKLLDIYRDSLIFNKTNGDKLVLETYDYKLLKKINNVYSERDMTVTIDLILDFLNKIKKINEKKILFEMTIYKILHVKHLFEIKENLTYKKSKENLQSSSSQLNEKSKKKNIDWKNEFIKISENKSYETLTPILGKAKYRLNRKGILYIGWDDSFYFQKGKDNEKKILEILKEIDEDRKMVLFDISNKKKTKDKNEKDEKNKTKTESKKKSKKKIIPDEDILEFKSNFSGQIIEIKEDK